jgi:hypothetical protein
LAPWAIYLASLLAGFQAWLWAVQGFWVEFAGASALAIALAHAACWPRTRYAAELAKARVLRRGADESVRAYWFRVTLAWLLCAVTSICLGFGLPYVLRDNGGIVTFACFLLLALSFAAVMMALQSLLFCIFNASSSASPEPSPERTREG